MTIPSTARACSPVRSVTSEVLVQKQVGHTMVQLPHVRHRLATSPQCGGLPRVDRAADADPPPASPDPSPTRRRRSRRRPRRALGRLDRPVRDGRQQLGAGGAAGLGEVGHGIAVDAFGQRQVVPGSAGGPVPIEVQKHSPPGSVQLTATMKAPCDGRCRRRPDVRPRSAPDPARRSRPGHSRARRGRRNGGSAAVVVVHPDDHTCWRCGCRNCFHDCGPAECPNAARSARSRTR